MFVEIFDNILEDMDIFITPNTESGSIIEEMKLEGQNRFISNDSIEDNQRYSFVDDFVGEIIINGFNNYNKVQNYNHTPLPELILKELKFAYGLYKYFYILYDKTTKINEGFLIGTNKEIYYSSDVEYLLQESYLIARWHPTEKTLEDVYKTNKNKKIEQNIKKYDMLCSTLDGFKKGVHDGNIDLKIDYKLENIINSIFRNIKEL
jgi:hypothetical protein